MQPWGEQIRVKQSVMVAMEEPVQEEEPVAEEVEKKVKLKITSIFTESDDDAPPVEVETKEPKKKNSKMRDKFK